MIQRDSGPKDGRAYLSGAGAWALAFGCAVGWGAFVMPGTTFLPVAGPLGTALGICLGGAVMLLPAASYHYLMNRYPDAGGTYTYTKKCFGYDHGFISAWFLILTYVAIIWANATALPLIARHLFGGLFQFGFHYYSRECNNHSKWRVPWLQCLDLCHHPRRRFGNRQPDIC